MTALSLNLTAAFFTGYIYAQCHVVGFIHVRYFLLSIKMRLLLLRCCKPVLQANEI